jgi:hypothetical protein
MRKAGRTANRSTVYLHPIIAPGPYFIFIIRSGKMAMEEGRFAGIDMGAADMGGGAHNPRRKKEGKRRRGRET